MWGGGGGGQGAIFMLLFLMLFFLIQAKHQIISLPNEQKLEEQHFNANIFISHTKGKPVYQ